VASSTPVINAELRAITTCIREGQQTLHIVAWSYNVTHGRHERSCEYTNRDSYSQTLLRRIVPLRIRSLGKEKQEEKFCAEQCGDKDAEYDCQALCGNDVVVVEVGASVSRLHVLLKILVLG